MWTLKGKSFPVMYPRFYSNYTACGLSMKFFSPAALAIAGHPSAGTLAKDIPTGIYTSPEISTASPAAAAGSAREITATSRDRPPASAIDTREYQ